MPMKKSDLRAAVSLLIQGYLRSHVDSGDGDNEPTALQDAITAITQESVDWADNLPAHAANESFALVIGHTFVDP